jgi:hypothetical protein
MNGWGTRREVEKPKTARGRRELLAKQCEEEAAHLRRRADAAIAVLGVNAPVVAAMRNAAELLDRCRAEFPAKEA